jgi:hypothetical protein
MVGGCAEVDHGSGELLADASWALESPIRLIRASARKC